jgi:hypothetical protein
MRLSPLSQVRGTITGKNRFPVTIRQIQATDQFEFRCTGRKMRSNVSHRRLAEEAAVFAIELCGAFVADLKKPL